ncbi:MBL fold metallo-hydrolase [Natronobacterium gregoryi]|uniref:MBL fold metallo-hydrolase n=2 Tax=Natronobacterium gregoryi TaxID=44930 RepID=L0AJV0_NATGS|nr:MBL fold metallo-hydrolase [Natronobacterium gregoryi]AFZ73335.1 Zn-dependent hydrolase, glyoxylase [Natronobacterium gregoryi SP2]PLK18798.1 MBL fold metallo-hydrolase [Natronobacterium gregoryi SP2]SFJ64136.1 Glyoxylase, beta-lactamase superfamily II [Natronobacterium gregoryi]
MRRRTHVHAFTTGRVRRDRTTTAVAVETDRGPVLVDIGPVGSVGALEVHLEAPSSDLEDVWLVVVTHNDGDPAGGLAELLEHTDAVVAAHREEAPYVAGERDPIKSGEGRYPPVDVDLGFADGVRIPTLAGPMAVVPTLGHAPGNVSLSVSESGVLLAGDALVADGEAPLSGPKPEFTPEMARALESVGKLAALEIEHTRCYHGGDVDRGSDRIREIDNERRS